MPRFFTKKEIFTIEDVHAFQVNLPIPRRGGTKVILAFRWRSRAGGAAGRRRARALRRLRARLPVLPATAYRACSRARAQASNIVNEKLWLRISLRIISCFRLLEKLEKHMLSFNQNFENCSKDLTL